MSDVFFFRLSDVRNVVHQLYEALNLRDHQLHKERQLCSHLELLKHELQPLEEVSIFYYFILLLFIA